ncbi:MAG: glutathionylspermidine synthase family protein [Massilia sp.]|nr:glutathionylspermidine synthase family protein [Massilia sp.]
MPASSLGPVVTIQGAIPPRTRPITGSGRKRCVGKPRVNRPASSPTAPIPAWYRISSSSPCLNWLPAKVWLSRGRHRRWRGRWASRPSISPSAIRKPTNYPVIGSWVVGGQPAGICLREDALLLTTNMSNFIPHDFVRTDKAR